MDRRLSQPEMQDGRSRTVSRTIFVACGSRRPYVPYAALKDAREERDRLREASWAVVQAWTQWIDTRSDEWMNAPEDPDCEALDEAVGDLGRLAFPERYR